MRREDRIASVSKVLSRMRELTEIMPPEAHPDTLGQTWPKVMSALESLFLAIDSQADDLKTILAAAKVPSKAAARVGRQIEVLFEELAGRPINRVKHHGEKLEACYCHTASVAVYGYLVAGVRGCRARAEVGRTQARVGQRRAPWDASGCAAVLEGWKSLSDALDRQGETRLAATVRRSRKRCSRRGLRRRGSRTRSVLNSLSAGRRSGR